MDTFNLRLKLTAAAFAGCLMELAGYSNHDGGPGRDSCTTDHGLISVNTLEGFCTAHLGIVACRSRRRRIIRRRATTALGNCDINGTSQSNRMRRVQPTLVMSQLSRLDCTRWCRHDHSLSGNIPRCTRNRVDMVGAKPDRNCSSLFVAAGISHICLHGCVLTMICHQR